MLKSATAPATRFEQLPRVYRRFFHGTRSNIAEFYSSHGVRHVNYRPIQEAVRIVRAILSDPIPAHLFMPAFYTAKDKGLAGYQFESRRSDLRVFPTAHHLLSTKKGVYLTSFFHKALGYSLCAPESRFALFGELDYFVLQVRKFHGDKYERQILRLKQLKSETDSLFKDAKPVVVELEIPRISYLSLEPGEAHEFSYDSVIARIDLYSPLPIASMGWSPLPDKTCGYTLAKPLEPRYILNIHEVSQN